MKRKTKGILLAVLALAAAACFAAQLDPTLEEINEDEDVLPLR